MEQQKDLAVELVPVPGVPELAAALQGGQADAALFFSAAGAKLHNKGALADLRLWSVNVWRALYLVADPQVGGLDDLVGKKMRGRFVFQESCLLPWRIALENVTLVLLDTVLDRDRREAQARDLLARVGLGGFETCYPAQLSGGMRQRVAIARALAVEPDFFAAGRAFRRAGLCPADADDRVFAPFAGQRGPHGRPRHRRCAGGAGARRPPGTAFRPSGPSPAYL